MSDNADDPAQTTRKAAALAAMISLLAVAVAPADDAAPPVTTQAISTTQAVTTTQAAVVVEAPRTRPATRAAPTTAQIVEAARRGDVFVQTAEAIGDLGLRDTFQKTEWWRWWYAVGVALAGVLLGRLVSTLLHRLGARQADRMNLIRAVALNSVAGPIGAFLVMFGLAFGVSRIELAPQVLIVLVRGWQLAVVAIVGWLLWNLVEVVSLTMLRASKGRQGHLSMMIVPVTRRTLRATILVTLLLFALYNVFDVQSVQPLLAGVGIAGLAVSLAAQDTLKQLFGSLMIFADRPFLIGDLVKIDAFEGHVEDIGFRSTRLRTADGFLVSIPNAKVADAAVTNYSRRKSIRRIVDLSFAYDTPPAKVAEALELLRDLMSDAAWAGDFDRTKEPPTVALDELRPNGMRARIIYWFRSNDPRAYAEHSERLNLSIVRRMDEAGIKFGWAN